MGTLGSRRRAQYEAGKQEKAGGEQVWSTGSENTAAASTRRLLREQCAELIGEDLQEVLIRFKGQLGAIVEE